MLAHEFFFDLASFEHKSLFDGQIHVWGALKNLKGYVNNYCAAARIELPADKPLAETLIIYNGEILASAGLNIDYCDATKGKLAVQKKGEQLEGASVIMAGTVLMGDAIVIGKGVLIESGALIKSPAIIGDNTEVRQGAYLRGYCLIGKRCVVGHVTEIKHSIFLDDAKAGHFAYLGDSILGNAVNLGAGTKMANLRFMSGDVHVRTPNKVFATGLRKLGAILGDHVQTGCNSVTNPGTLLGKRAIVFPNTTVPSGYHADSSLIR
ncbi:MAG: hypothetical protein KKG70_12250 [Proteobacteria bacterium]|nr:hypothetical protein [Pseudomonadota bacterium]